MRKSLLFLVIFALAGNALSAQTPNTAVLSFFGLSYPHVPNEQQALRVVAGKQHLQALRATYQFEPRSDHSPSLNIEEYHEFEPSGAIRSSHVLVKKGANDTLNQTRKEYAYDAVGNLASLSFIDLKGYEPNKKEIYAYDDKNRLIARLLQDPLFQTQETWQYNNAGQLIESEKETVNLELDTKIKIHTNYAFENDTLKLQNFLVGQAEGSGILKSAEWVTRRDTMLAHYVQSTSDTLPKLVAKYWYNRHKRIVRSAFFHDNPFLPQYTTLFAYYPSGQLRTVQDIKGAGNLQAITAFLPTGELLSLDILEERTKREYFYSPADGLPLRTDLYQNGTRRGQIVYQVIR